MEKVRVVAVFVDGTQMPCDIYLDKSKSLIDNLNHMPGDFVECMNATFNGKTRCKFVMCKKNLLGFVPIQ